MKFLPAPSHAPAAELADAIRSTVESVGFLPAYAVAVVALAIVARYLARTF